jgi:hypothetical protein
MTGLSFVRLWPVWLVLCALTLGSAGISHEQGLTRLAVIGIFAIAALKAELVLDSFMEAPMAETHWQWLYRLWIAAVTMILAVGFSGN